MTTNKLMTWGAIAFAGFAIYWITRKPGGQVHAQPGQAQRDAGLQAFQDLYAQQAREIEATSYALSIDRFKSLLGA